jgi:gamma-glutamylcyclotransferase (GGCT)/AIG2-like uncharacterized protein YtfP
MNEKEPCYLFAYGTLRKEFESPVNKKIARFIEWIGVGEISGKLYDMGHYPAAIPAEENERSVISGAVMKINLPAIVLKILDDFEGCIPGNETESEYCRKNERVVLNDGTVLYAWVYWYLLEVSDSKRITEKDYLNYLKKIPGKTGL